MNTDGHRWGGAGRWYPKGTDFSRVSVQAIAVLEDRINAIHRRSLDGSTALQCFLQESA